MRKTLLIGFVAGLLFASCKSSIKYVDKTHTSEPGREIPYQQFIHKKPSSHLALVIPDSPDTLNISQSALTRMLKKEGYDLLIVGKPGTTKDEIRGLDSRENRILDATSLFINHAVEGYQHRILIGVGEGAYVVPKLRSFLKTDTSICINMNPYSPLAAYEQWLSADSLSSYQQKILEYKNIVDIRDLGTRIESMKANTEGVDGLDPNSNLQWMSYYNSPVRFDVMKGIEPLYWINFEQYPMISAAHQKEAALYTNPFTHFISLPGKGNLNNEEQINLLVEKLRVLVSYK